MTIEFCDFRDFPIQSSGIKFNLLLGRWDSQQCEVVVYLEVLAIRGIDRGEAGETDGNGRAEKRQRRRLVRDREKRDRDWNEYGTGARIGQS